MNVKECQERMSS